MIKKIVSLNIWIFTLKMNLINEIFEFSRKKSNWKAFDFSNFGSKTQIFHWFIFSVKIQIFEWTIFFNQKSNFRTKIGLLPQCAIQDLLCITEPYHLRWWCALWLPKNAFKNGPNISLYWQQQQKKRAAAAEGLITLFYGRVTKRHLNLTLLWGSTSLTVYGNLEFFMGIFK